MFKKPGIGAGFVFDMGNAFGRGGAVSDEAAERRLVSGSMCFLPRVCKPICRGNY
jgi:hypothetical protein